MVRISAYIWERKDNFTIQLSLITYKKIDIWSTMYSSSYYYCCYVFAKYE